MAFGRKGLGGESGAEEPGRDWQPADPDLHAKLCAAFDVAERGGDPYARLAAAGGALFDYLYHISAKDGAKGARVEDLLGVLGAIGGFSCIVGTLHFMVSTGRPLQSPEVVMMRAPDGQIYYFGDLPNSALLESGHSLLSITLGAAQDCGGEVSLERVHAVMKRTAASVGQPPFGVDQLPGAHRPRMTPQQIIRGHWHQLVEPLDWFGVTPSRRATAIGIAIKQAIEVSKDVIDPGLAADIVTEYAVPAAKFDPAAYGVTFTRN